MIDERKKIKNIITTISLPDKTIKKIEELANKNNVTRSMMIRIMTDKYKD